MIMAAVADPNYFRGDLIAAYQVFQDVLRCSRDPT